MPEQETPGEEWGHLLAEAKRAMSKGEDIEVPSSKIRPMPNQPRAYFNEESISRLAHSIKGVGQIQRGILRRIEPEGEIEYEIIDGERRWRATKMAGVKYRATLVQVSNKTAPFIIAAVANFNREDHTPLEVVDSIDRMLKLKIPMEEISNILGISLHWAYQMHGLTKLVPAVRDMLDPNQPTRQILQVTAAIHISKAHPDIQKGLAQKVRDKKVTLAELRREVIRTSETAGYEVRRREQRPDKILRSVENQGRQLLRLALDYQLYLGTPEVQKVLRRAHPREIFDFTDRMNQTNKKISEIKTSIVASR